MTTDEFGMQLKTDTAPNWAAALAYAQAIIQADGDEDAQQEAVEHYLNGRGPDDVLGELGCTDIWPRDVAQARELFEQALANETPYAAAAEVNGGFVLTTQPNTGADELVESLWRTGVLAAAGFDL